VDELERILEEDERIEPSSGLADAVMRAVLDEAGAPPPVPFPWLRLALGMGACLALLATGVAVALIQGLPEPASLEPNGQGLDPRMVTTVGVPLGTLLLTFLASRVALRAMR
jgi:hypothetical protein